MSTGGAPGRPIPQIGQRPVPLPPGRKPIAPAPNAGGQPRLPTRPMPSPPPRVAPQQSITPSPAPSAPIRRPQHHINTNEEHTVTVDSRHRVTPPPSPSKNRHTAAFNRILVLMLCVVLTTGFIALGVVGSNAYKETKGLDSHTMVTMAEPSEKEVVIDEAVVTLTAATATTADSLDIITETTAEIVVQPDVATTPPTAVTTAATKEPSTATPHTKTAATASLTVVEPPTRTEQIVLTRPETPGPAGPVDLMVKSVFPKTKDGYPLFSNPPTSHFSSFYCIGGRGRQNSQKDRSCRFQNLCYQAKHDKWLYYMDPKQKDYPILMDHGNIYNTFPDKLLNLRSMGIEQDAIYWSPHIVYDSIPEGSIVPRKNKNHPNITVLYHPHYPSNIGHVIGDDLFPIFNLMSSFGMLTNDAQLIISRDCDKIFADVPKKADSCRMFMKMLVPGMSSTPYLAATQKDLKERLGMPTEQEIICFENVLAGNGPWGFQQSLGKAPSWWDYHHFYLSNIGLNPNHTPKKHRITISIKDGKRSIFNNQEMVDHLTKVLPDYEIDAIELKTLGSWKNELKYLLDTTVLITPCGGVSMSAMFLPHGSSLIVVDYWHVGNNNTAGMEERLWANLGFIRAFHYPFYENEVMLEAENKDGKQLRRDKQQDMRDWGRVKINMERMEVVVRAAIQHVDNFMVMGST